MRSKIPLRQRLLIFPLVAAALLHWQCGTAPVVPGSPTPDDPPRPPSVTETATVKFFAFGDWGTGDANQQAVATAMVDHCETAGCDFGILLGDNFYETGVSGTDDPQWQDKFESVYAGFNGPFYAILGNHDDLGNPQAEIDYTQLQDRWKMPAATYSVAFPLDDPNPILEIFVIDSETASPDSAEPLRQEIAASNATWKILALHHPLYSNGLHGDDSAGINSALIPAICDQVTLALSGHDHLFSHLDEPADGCTFQQVVVGTGGKSLYAANPDPRALYSESSFGFGYFTADSEKLVLQFWRSDGSLAYQTEWTQ